MKTTTTMKMQITLPGSKSIAARALVCRMLSGHDTRIENLPVCGDTDGMLRLTQSVRMAEASGEAVNVNIGEGGTTLRFGMAACASIPGLNITLAGSERLMVRPHAILVEALKSLGADIRMEPFVNSLQIYGCLLKGGMVELDGSISSQYLSAMMLAAPVWENNTVFRIKKPVVSFPYISMTAGVMRDFGAHVAIEDKEDYLEVTVKADGYAQCARYAVEGDWSAASYFFEANLIKCKMLSTHRSNFPALLDSSDSSDISSLFLTSPEFLTTLKAPAESLQGDSRVAAIFGEATRRVKEGDRSVMLMNLNETPDLVPAIAVGLCIAGVPFRIEGVAHLRHKESDRMAAISAEIRKLGYVLECREDSMEWLGRDSDRCEPEENPLIRTYKDHRMAMAFASAAMLFPNIRVEDPDVVKKSFPGFWQEIDKVMHNTQCTMHN